MILGALNQKHRQAFTLIELLLVIVILAVFAAMMIPTGPNGKGLAQRVYCVNNLKQVGLGYLLWEGDHGSFPAEVSTNNGGTRELVSGADGVLKSYQVMSDKLFTPKILYCPADAGREKAATNFGDDLKGRISYFIGLDARTNLPGAFLSGDDNLGLSGEPVKSGLVALGSNSPVAWTANRHGLIGNIGLVDGSVQMLTGAGLSNYLGQTGLATNRIAIP